MEPLHPQAEPPPENALELQKPGLCLKSHHKLQPPNQVLGTEHDVNSTPRPLPTEPLSFQARR
jgi:hypothetical protein